MHTRNSALALMAALVVTGLLTGASLPASSTEPKPAPPSSAPTFSTPAVAPVSAAPAKAPGATPAPPAGAVAPSPEDVAASDATARSARSLGYYPRMRDGKTVYCRKDAKVGTRLETTTCVPPELIGALVNRSRANRESVVELQRESLNQQGGDSRPNVSQLSGPTYR